MPVWHELSKAWRETYDLAVIGIAQEQHAERCALYARWQRFDWPILWDPFNLTEDSAVPLVYAIDEAGVVRAVQPDPATFEEQFLQRQFVAEAAGPTANTRGPPTAPTATPPHPPRLVECSTHSADTPEGEMWGALSELLFTDAAARPWDAAVASLSRYADDHPDDARARFRLGVSLRMRYDSQQRQPRDFQQALDAWSAALAAQPNEYIWRRRIQQYGPTLDKPYPFYPWIDEALAALTERGEQAPVLSVALTGAERADPRRALDPAEPSLEPDADDAVRHDDGSWLELDTAVAHHTQTSRAVLRVHVDFRPLTENGVHWNNEAEPLLVWFGNGTLPPGWQLDRQLVRVPGKAGQVLSSEVRHADVELRLPENTTGSLTGHALFYACEDQNGVCTYLRRDFEISISPR